MIHTPALPPGIVKSLLMSGWEYRSLIADRYIRIYLGVAGLAYIDKDDDGNSKTRFGGMLKFKYDIINLVGESGLSQDGEDEVKGMGFAAATEIKSPVAEGPMKNLALIGRLDSWDKDTDKDDNEVMRVIVGVSYEIVKGAK